MSKTPSKKELLLNEAIALAAEVHKHQIRQEPDGRPYICHILDVVNSIPKFRRTTRIIAALHDTLEDSSEDQRAKLRKIIKERFGNKVLLGVEAISHFKKEGLTQEQEIADYLNYITNQVSKDRRATLVKLADNYVNMKDRIHFFMAGDEEQKEKARQKVNLYAQSIAKLTEKPKSPK
jgi:(p)ppGpp synthase/HD superfamily hydrolase